MFVVNSASQQEGVASFVGNQIKAKEGHLMRLYMRKVAVISSSFLGSGIHRI